MYVYAFVWEHNLVSVFFRTCSQVVKVRAVQNGNTGSLYYQEIEALNFYNFSHPLQRLTNEGEAFAGYNHIK